MKNGLREGSHQVKRTHHMSNEIYRSTVMGNEMTPLVKVECLPPAELAVCHRIADLGVVIAEARLAESEITQLRKDCKHHYFSDTAGFLYDLRHCVVCGAHMGLV